MANYASMIIQPLSIKHYAGITEYYENNKHFLNSCNLGGHFRCSRSDTSHLWKELELADSVAFTVSPAQAIAEVLVLHIENLTT